VSKLLVTGGAGYLGSELSRIAHAQGHEVLATQLHAPAPHGHALTLDIRDTDAVERVLMRHGPDVVVHTAYRQQGPEARETIVKGSHNVGTAAHRAGARLIHISTDLVFDGEQGAPYAEDAEPRPVMEYGAAKLEAERVVARAHPEATIVRTSILYGTPGAQEALAARDDVELYTDEIRCPTRVDELSTALLELAELDLPGLLHLAAPEAISRYEFARLLRAAAGEDPDAVRGAPSPRDGRARNVALDSSRAAQLLETRLRGAHEALGPG
jgi:dTDP-4-dehydrorhamnose reductase